MDTSHPNTSLLTTAILLAGGQASRMNYQDKAWLEYQGTPMIISVLKAISPGVAGVFISTGHDHVGYASIDYPCIADENAGFEGPLEGIATCACRVATPYTLIVTCDVPMIPASLCEDLHRAIGNHDICIASDGDQLHYLVMLAKTDALGDIRSYLATGRKSVNGWLEGKDVTVATFPEEKNYFRNINDPEQL